MVKNDLFISVPSLFKCPISLDVMKSPVSLCTGVTYDRSSIQRWLDNGNNTCPATMQVLHSKDTVPNTTVHRLIQIWSDSVTHFSDTGDSPASSSPSLSQEQATVLIKKIENRSDNCFDCLSKILDFARDSDENRKFLAKIDGFVPVIVGVLGNVDVEIRVVEQVVRVLDLILTEYGDKEQLMRLILKGNPAISSSIVLVLQKGSLDSRIRSARLFEAIAVDAESKLLIAEKEGLLAELFSLVSSEMDLSAIEAGLSCLITVSMPRRTKVKIVRLGVVQILGKLISQTNSGVLITEKAMKLLEMVSTCTEGRTEICEDPLCIPAIVQKMLKVSNSATEHAVVILWSVCYLFRDKNAQEAVMKSNGLTKILLLMQSNCSLSVRQMSSDLLKIFQRDRSWIILPDHCIDAKTDQGKDPLARSGTDIGEINLSNEFRCFDHREGYEAIRDGFDVHRKPNRNMRGSSLHFSDCSEIAKSIKFSDRARGCDTVERLSSLPRSERAGGGDEEQRIDEDLVVDAEQLLAVSSSNVQRSTQDLTGKLKIMPFELRY
ncbi:hypothetical protein HHK36_007940 [Tetracentron sinense]|uniref:U-box domain-containing protein n=1 Tax=Tetracentron sinense TaxID=13715 RepID=A0A834ZP79_TETSI|nr:hypothetical protein HHK36_007940 [Tetracentron sinense]